MAENTKGLVTPKALPLTKICFSSEQERLEAFAEALQLPVEAGEAIKGDKGEQGLQGIIGPAGPSGQSAGLTYTETLLSTGLTSFTVDGDLRKAIINMCYSDEASDPATKVGILCIRFNGTNTKVFFTVATPDDKYKLCISRY